MSAPRLPPYPPGLAALSPTLVGAAARHVLGARPPRTPPEAWVDAEVGEVVRRCPEAREVVGRPDWLWVGPWQVCPSVAQPEQRLAEAVSPLAGLGVAPDGAVIDPLGGLEDLHARRVRRSPRARSSDPQLGLEMIELAGELQAELDEATLAEITEAAPAVFRAPRAEVQRALTAILVSRGARVALERLAATGLLAYTLPEVSALIDLHRSSRFHHKDVWAHTCQVVEQAVPRAELRWAALLHDVGKVHTRTYGPGRAVHFHRHDEVGALLVEGITARLRFDPALAEEVRFLVLHHLRANLYERSWSDSAVRRFVREMGPAMPEVLALSRADVTSRRPGRRREALFTLHHLRTRVDALSAEDTARRPLIPKGLGAEIIDALGVAPGPRVGELRRLCEDAVRDGKLSSGPEVHECIEFLRTQVERSA